MRAKCVCKPLISSAYVPSRGLQRPSPESVKGLPFLFLKPQRPISQVSITDPRKRVLYSFIKQLQNIQKGNKRQLPGNFLDVLGVSRPRVLAFSDPGVQLISFLLRDGRGTLAVRVFSTFLHRGYHFSSTAIRHLCEDASALVSPKPATAFAEYISTALSRSPEKAISIIERLIKTFYSHGKHEAVLTLGSLILAKEGLSAEPPHYRRILQSMLKVHGLSCKTYPGDNLSAVKALLSFLGDWLQALHRDGHHLDQMGVTMLIQQLFPLLQKQHRRERPLPRALHLWVFSLVEKLSLHLSGPISKLAFAESYLDSLDKLHTTKAPLSSTKPKVTASAQTYGDIMRWTKEWKQTILDHGQSPIMYMPPLELFATKGRVLKILVRDRVIAGDEAAALEHLQEIASLQAALSPVFRRTGQSSRLTDVTATDRPAWQCIRDARLRYISMMVRVCSHYLRKQELPALFLVLPFTTHINDLGTFVRLWKRVLHLVIQKGRWGGALGLDALLTLLARSIPRLWEKTVVGNLLFTSPTLLQATLRVALDKSSQQKRTEEGRWDAETAELMALVQDNPQAFRHWEAAITPFIGTLRSPRKDALQRVNSGHSDEKIRLERSLLSRLVPDRTRDS